MACKPTGAPRVVNNFDWEWITVTWPGVAPLPFLSDYPVSLTKGRRCFYIVSNKPVSEVFMHFAPMMKYTKGGAAWIASVGLDQWIPFPGSSRQPIDVNNQIQDICAIEFDEDTFVKDFYLSAWNGAGGTPNSLVILCSTKPVKFFASKT